jgi:dihydroneopterin aldolase
MTDYIIANGIALSCRIGWPEEERLFPQRLLVSLRMGVDTRAAARSLRLEDSVCYLQVCDALREFAASRTWVLVEELAESAVELLFERFPLIESVNMVIQKFVLPGVEWTGVEITRERGYQSCLNDSCAASSVASITSSV